MAKIRYLKIIILLSSLFLSAALALFATTLGVNACEIGESPASTCSSWHARVLPSPTATATPTPRGDRPETARTFTDTWSSIDPRASIWYKTEDSPGYREIELWVDTPIQGALGLSVLSPDQMDSWWNARPVGRGSYNPGMPSHALTWTAAYAKPGVWYALLQNNSDVSVSYQLGGNIASTPTKLCHGYWETLNGAPIYWIDCNPIHNPQ